MVKRASGVTSYYNRVHYVGDFGELIGSETGEFGRHWVKVRVVE